MKFFDFGPVNSLFGAATVGVDQPQLAVRKIADGFDPAEHSEEVKMAP